ncbi:SAM-dependent methyltransferase [Actinoplanes tereljensis]|uniref:S-adenosyl methyltransferase n=1 Tax=Paractinoplanes tereljensis TaxID=571912 RepID=A0A919NRS2_9ACTN|nr:SAM-dependent methyltransferase [Actinoplanes tereljensis]GIF23890.1 hypothetical protein Ate02nite_66200 [Actinoplanes tereljensis]
MTQGSRPVDTQVAHIARVYDYWLGGKDNFAIDRQVADMMKEDSPEVVEGVLGNRAFLARTVRCLAADYGVRQFLDIGTGLPAANNTHEVAPDSRVVYVDNDPIVLSHARALLTGADPGATAYLDADLRDTERILREAADTLDFGRPVAVMLIAVLHCITDEDDPAAIVRRLMAALVPGSFLVLSHPAIDIHSGVRKAASRMNQLMHTRLTFRDHGQVASFFDGLELLEPGVVRVPDWRPVTEADRTNPAAVWGGVGRLRA